MIIMKQTTFTIVLLCIIIAIDSVRLELSQLSANATELLISQSAPNATLSKSTNGIYHHNDISSPDHFDRFWSSIKRIVNITDDQFVAIADQIATISVELNQTTSQCYQTIERAFRIGLQQRWSAKLINSNAFISGGFVNSLISERYTSLGDYVGCISQQHVTLDTISFSGKYCLASLKTPQLAYYSKSVEANKFANISDYFEQVARNWLVVRNRFPFALGICAPSVCSTEQLTILIRKYFEQYLDGIDLEIGYCQVDTEPKKFSLGFIISLCILGFMVATSFLATILYKFITFLQISTAKVHPTPTTTTSSTLKSKLNWQLVIECINCFNVEYNLRCLFQVDTEGQKQKYTFDLRFIHGLKAIMILLTVFVHSTSFMTMLLFTKLSIFTRYPSFYYQMEKTLSLFYNVVIRGFLLVDIFFVISGFLVAYMVLSKARKTPNFTSYVLLRWIRLVPNIVAILCLTIVFQKLGKGPMFHEELTDPYVKPCYDYWWTHILFINNFWTIDKMCGPNLWFIAADFQLHVLLYLVIFVYFRKKLAAYVVSIALIVGSLSSFFVFNLLKLPGWPRVDFPVRFQFPAPLDSIRLFYTLPHTHILAYFFGAIVAMRLIKKRKPPTSSTYPDLMILLSIITVTVITLYPIKAIESDLNEDRSFTFLLVFGICFIVIMLAEGFLIYFLILARTSFVKRFLSTKFLIPIGRLSYGIYLLNPLVNWFNIQQNWDTQRLTIQYLSFSFTSIYFQCFILSIFLHLFFQSPLYNLSQLFIKRNQSDGAHHSKIVQIDSQPPLTSSISHVMSNSSKSSAGTAENHSVDEHVQLRSFTSGSTIYS